jgi:hypothetical protein
MSWQGKPPQITSIGRSLDELVSVEESNVSEPCDSRPALCEYGTAEPIALAEGDGLESACGFESKAESAEAAEEVEDTQHHPVPSSSYPAAHTARMNKKTMSQIIA